MIARGTVAGGFSRPLELTAHGAGGLHVAELASGLTYVAWTELPVSRSRWRLAVIRDGHISRPTLLPRDAQLQGLFAGRLRNVAAVWVTAHRGRFPIHYAFLGPKARIHRRGDIAVMPHQSTYPQVAVNDRGEIAAVWTQGASQTPMLGLCAGTGRCAAARRIPVPSAAFENAAVALADNGTATVLAGGHRGLWGAVAHVGQRRQHASEIAATGDFPVAAAAGKNGAIATFEPTGDTLAFTFLRPKRDAFTKPQQIPDAKVDGAIPAVLAANLKGEFVAAWSHFTRFQNPNYEIRASIGNGSTPRKPVTIVPASQDEAETSVLTGIDGLGNTIVTWCKFGGPTGGAGDHGLFEAIHIRH